MTQDLIHIADKGTYLLVEFSGEFSVEAGKLCMNKIAEACLEHQRQVVLLDVRRVTGDLPLMDRFAVAEYGVTKNRHIKCIALLNREDMVLPDKFIENVVVNRGVNMKSFTDCEEAEDWLTHANI